MESDSPQLFMSDGVLLLHNPLNSTEAALFNNLFVNTDINLVHFMPANRFIQLLESKQIYLRRLDGYTDDSMEGIYPEINLLESSDMDIQFELAFRTVPDRQSRYQQALIARKMTYIHCWFKGNPSNRYMWKKYGHDGNGVCIEASTKRLRECISFDHSKFNATVGKCVYTNPKEPIPSGPSWFPALRKDKERFEMEEEIRFLIQYKANRFNQIIGLDDLPEFQKLPVDLNGLISSVYLGPNIVTSEKEAISQAIHDAGLAEKLKPLQ